MAVKAPCFWQRGNFIRGAHVAVLREDLFTPSLDNLHCPKIPEVFLPSLPLSASSAEPWIFPELRSSIVPHEADPREALPKLSSWYDHLLLPQFAFRVATNRLATCGATTTALTMIADIKKRHNMGGGGSYDGSQGSDKRTRKMSQIGQGSGNAVPDLHVSYQSNTYGRSGTGQT